MDMATQRWRSIRSTIGVTRLVCNGDDPAVLAAGVVDVSASPARTSAVSSGWRPRPRFAIGEQVRIVDEIFASCLGLFDGISDSERVAVLLDMLGRKVRVVLNVDCVAAV